MQVIYDGKTKRVFRAGDRAVFQFKDTLTGDAAGNINPGGDYVVGRLDGKGVASAKVAACIFKLMGEAGIATHFCKLRSNNEIEVTLTGRIPLEVVYRAKACGSFLARYRGHIEPMASLDIVEFNLKDDALGDPLITHEGIARLGLASEGELREMEAIAHKVAALVAGVLGERGLELVDMKLEFGRSNDRLLVIDELSGDTMRIFDHVQKRLINQVELAEKLGLT